MSNTWVSSHDSLNDAMSLEMPLHLLANMDAMSQTTMQTDLHSEPTSAMLASQQRALVIIGDFPRKVPKIFAASARGFAKSAASTTLDLTTGESLEILNLVQTQLKSNGTLQCTCESCE